MIKLINRVKKWLRDAKVKRLTKRMIKDWRQLEHFMIGLPSWQKKQIREDMIKGNYANTCAMEKEVVCPSKNG